jgi:hypothetical protein
MQTLTMRFANMWMPPYVLFVRLCWIVTVMLRAAKKDWPTPFQRNTQMESSPAWRTFETELVFHVIYHWPAQDI